MKRKYLTSWFKKNGPTICTIGACVGVVATSVLSVRAGMKIRNSLDDRYDDKFNQIWNVMDTNISLADAEEQAKLTKIETISTCWTYYIPVVGSLLGTCFCIIGSNKLNKKNQAALASMYMGAQQYISQLKETLAKNGIEEIEMSNNLLNESLDDFVSEDDEKHLFYIYYVCDDIGTTQGQYFESTIRDVVLSEYHINRNFILKGSKTVNAMLEWFNCKKIPMGDTIGWEMGNDTGYQWIDFDHEKVTIDDGTERDGMDCYIISTPFDAEVFQYE